MDLSKFKQVPGWTEYLINKEGVLVSLKYDKEKVLKPRTQVNGYQVISFFRMENGEAIREQRLIHRLVMLMFGPDQPSETHRVHLMDFNLLNYGIHNLEWLEHSECTKRAWERNRKLGNKMGRQSRPIICTVNDKVVKHFESIKSATKSGYSNVAVRCYEQQTYKGLKWYWAEDYIKTFGSIDNLIDVEYITNECYG